MKTCIYLRQNWESYKLHYKHPSIRLFNITCPFTESYVEYAFVFPVLTSKFVFISRCEALFFFQSHNVYSVSLPSFFCSTQLTGNTVSIRHAKKKGEENNALTKHGADWLQSLQRSAIVLPLRE